MALHRYIVVNIGYWFERSFFDLHTPYGERLRKTNVRSEFKSLSKVGYLDEVMLQEKPRKTQQNTVSDSWCKIRELGKESLIKQAFDFLGGCSGWIKERIMTGSYSKAIQYCSKELIAMINQLQKRCKDNFYHSVPITITAYSEEVFLERAITAFSPAPQNNAFVCDFPIPRAIVLNNRLYSKNDHVHIVGRRFPARGLCCFISTTFLKERRFCFTLSREGTILFQEEY